MKFEIHYRVRGREGIFVAGPYPQEDVEYQRRDIETYYGVWDVKMLSVLPDIDVDENVRS